MNQVTFGAGYGDPNRTIAKKLSDYGTIDEKIKDLYSKNEKIQSGVDKLRKKVTNLVQSFQNVKGMDATATKAQISKLNEQIAAKENEINTNTSLISELWYGYHERL